MSKSRKDLGQLLNWHVYQACNSGKKVARHKKTMSKYGQGIHGLFRAHVAKNIGKAIVIYPMNICSLLLLQYGSTKEKRQTKNQNMFLFLKFPKMKKKLFFILKVSVLQSLSYFRSLNMCLEQSQKLLIFVWLVKPCIIIWSSLIAKANNVNI